MESLLQEFFCEAVECSTHDLQVTLDGQAAELRVVDATPGGNGLSEALLSENRLKNAWSTAIKQVRTYERKPPQAFRHYIAEECCLDSDAPAKEVLDAINRLADAWNG